MAKDAEVITTRTQYMNNLCMWFMRLCNGRTIENLVAMELDAARRGLLSAQTAKEFATSVCIYHEERIRRLSQITETTRVSEQKKES